MSRVQIPVAQLEFDRGGHTIWVHGPDGATVLRIQCTGKIVVTRCDTSPTAHSDIRVQGSIDVCVSKAWKRKT